MSGGKNKSKAPQAPALPGALPGPVLNVSPVPQPMPGQMDLIAQQLGQSYPSMPQADMLRNLQSIYTPPPVAPAPVLPAPVLTAAPGQGIPGQGLGEQKLSKEQEWEEMLMRRYPQG